MVLLTQHQESDLKQPGARLISFFIKTFLMILLLAFSRDAISQEKKPARYYPPLPRIVYPQCKFVPSTWADETHQISFLKGELSLKQYFDEGINFQQRESLTGTIMVQLLINAAGKACCKAVIIKSGNIKLSQVPQLKLDSLVNNMPHWTIKNPVPAHERGGNYTIFIDLEFYRNRTLKVTYDPTVRRKFIQGVPAPKADQKDNLPDSTGKN